MPYIKKELRLKLENEIRELYKKIDNIIEYENGGSPCNKATVLPGVLNYIITRLLTDCYCPNLSYFNINTMIGVLECCKQEMYRRLSCYEDMAISKNGDIAEYEFGSQGKL